MKGRCKYKSKQKRRAKQTKRNGFESVGCSLCCAISKFLGL